MIGLFVLAAFVISFSSPRTTASLCVSFERIDVLRSSLSFEIRVGPEAEVLLSLKHAVLQLLGRTAVRRHLAGHGLVFIAFTIDSDN